ncbi:hypothetical protein PR202_ga27056 [Eleusine coracana subsp. coracana]|uniref:Protein kinase domain-containing protein n=1 Tax=Eleusine coracana subsp. coracana TaxID=191504 RepID=A0AAV5DFS1_ELECO|nr:hypothetical protein PR202_ga27056 [Eleusine coracana subsp. coracana]
MMSRSSSRRSAGRRSDPSGSGDLSRFSVATMASSASERSVDGGGRGTFLDAFRSCFVPTGARSPPETSLSDDFHNSHQLSQSLSSQGSSSGSTFDSKRSIRGLYSPLHKNASEREIPGSTKFSLPEIQKATKNFSPNLKIGQGGSGTNVYDKQMGREFRNEIETLQHIEHLNLVRFHGYLEFGGEQLIIVEYVSNGNLREHLDRLNGKMLEFSLRLDIAIDVAHAITYLHTYSGDGELCEGNAIQTLDPSLEATDAINLAVEKMYELALQCLAPTKRNRPSMRRCAEILWSIRKDFRELVVPTSAMN